MWPSFFSTASSLARTENSARSKPCALQFKDRRVEARFIVEYGDNFSDSVCPGTVSSGSIHRKFRSSQSSNRTKPMSRPAVHCGSLLPEMAIMRPKDNRMAPPIAGAHAVSALAEDSRTRRRSDESAAGCSVPRSNKISWRAVAKATPFFFATCQIRCNASTNA